MGAEGARRALVEGLTRGASLVNYVGHGSVDRVRASLITNETATGLRHGRLPVWVAMTCLNGYFVDPRLDALGEALLKNPEGGAVAVWASAGTCAPEPQAVMNAAFYRSLRNGGRLGDAVGAAKRSVQDGDVRRTWILLGDPSLPLK